MNRRGFLAGGVATAGLLASRTSFAGSLHSLDDANSVHMTVDASKGLGEIAPDFMGLGYEIASVARPGLLSRRNAVYVELVRTLGAKGVIRIGGNTADYAHYLSNAAAVSSPYGTVVDDAALRDLGEFLDEVGWKLIWGLDLGKGSVAEAVAEARAVLLAAKGHLLAFEIGNEPDLFPNEKHRKPGYSYEDWLADYRRYKSVLRMQIPDIPFAGPDAAGKTDWVTRFATDEGRDAVLLTHHYYREGQSSKSTIDKLLGVDPKLLPQLDALRTASVRSGLPYRICEVNSFSGGGRPGVSDTMASALWVLDYMFTLAANGCSGVNMETGVNQHDFVSSYSPIGDDEQGHYVATPEYYGMLAFSRAGKGRLLRTTMPSDKTTLKAYATEPREGLTTLTLINKGSEVLSVFVDLLGGAGNRHATILRLCGPAVDAKTGITFGGAEVSSAGRWKPVREE